jgi:hypothetical protein
MSKTSSSSSSIHNGPTQEELRKLRLSPNEIRKISSQQPPFDVAALAHW